MEYKSVSKFLNNKQQEFSLSKFIKGLLVKILCCFVILLIGLIVLKYDHNNSNTIYNFIYENNFSFAKLNALYKKYLGDILPFQSKANDKIVSVFNEPLTYKNLNIYKDGVKLEVTENYSIPILADGIVTFVGDKDDYGKTVIVQQTDGVDVWYGNVTNVNVTLYDYVNKGELLAIANGSKLYLAFQKEGKFVNYKEYFK